MSEITHLASAAADLLISDCQLAPFRRDEAARIIQDTLDWAEKTKPKDVTPDETKPELAGEQ